MEEKELPYLKEALNLKDLKKKKETGYINLIIAPCGSGKTTAALEKIASLASDRCKVVYLIDTAAGRNALTNRNGTQRPTYEWRKDMEDYCEWWGEKTYSNGVRVMTYHLFGLFMQDDPEWFNGIEMVICDEIHNLAKYIDIDNAKKEAATGYCKTAFETLIHAKDKYIVAMTATPQRILKRLSNNNVSGHKLDFRGKVHSYQTKQIKYYSNLDTLISELSGNEKVLIYNSHVTGLKNIQENVWWCNVLALWSIWSAGHHMSDAQLDARDNLITKERFPEGVEWLCINSAYETGLNIEDEDLQTVVVNDSNADTITQVRGRVRHDIETLYLVDKNLEHVGEYIPDKYRGRKLFQEDLKGIIETLGLKDNGSFIGVPKLKSLLEAQGYVEKSGKEGGKQNRNKHYVIIRNVPI